MGFQPGESLFKFNPNKNVFEVLGNNPFLKYWTDQKGLSYIFHTVFSLFEKVIERNVKKSKFCVSRTTFCRQKLKFAKFFLESFCLGTKIDLLLKKNFAWYEKNVSLTTLI